MVRAPLALALVVASCLLAVGWAALPSRLYPSAAVHHLEPVTAVSVYHKEQHLPSSVRERRLLNGFYRPLPDHVRLAFSAYNRSHVYDLEVVQDLFAPGSTTVTHDPATGAEVRVPHRLATYQARFDNGWVTATFNEDGTFQAVVALEDELLQVDPLFLHEAELHPTTFGLLANAAKHKMVAFRLEDLRDGPEYRRECGAVKPPPPEDDEKEVPVGPAGFTVKASASASVSYPVPPLNSRKLLAVARWTNCFPNDHISRKLFVGVATDLGYYKRLGSSLANVQSSIAQVFASCNNVYYTQLNVYLQVAETIIMQTAGTYTWNHDRTAGNCPTKIGTREGTAVLLDIFTAWRAASKPQSQGLWQLFTDCFPPSGTVGMAWIGVLCSSSNGAGWNSYSSTLWLTAAHEIGHNFGADHTFQEGQGNTGGIMDYGDGKLNGEYQFHTGFSKDQMCGEITRSMSTNRAGMTPLAACWATYAPECGNGIIEEGEECDDPSSCCNNCQLASGAQCSGGDCCDAQCKFKLTSSMCPLEAGEQGYCANGVCAPSACKRYGMAYCGTKPTNPCRQNCYNKGVCTDMDGMVDSETRLPFNRINSSELCSASPYSTCVGDGVCTAASPTYSWHTGTWGTCSKTCGSGTQTRTVQCRDNSGTPVSDSMCTGIKPATSQACSTQACPTYSWNTGNWGTCSKTCGSGTQTRTVTCRDGSGGTVSDSYCAGTKPSTSQSCNTHACPTWNSGEWGSCSATCGSGTQTRTVTCRDHTGGTVSDSLCTGTKPVTSQSCNTQACPVWNTGPWGSCSVTCGGGTQTRTVQCRDHTGATVPDASCSGTKPATSQSCNTQVCLTYSWYSGGWGACSATCGGGTRTRTVQCRDNFSAVVADSFCSGAGTKPATSQACNTPACVTYSWRQDVPWGTCSTTCGGGTQTRPAECVSSQGSTVDNSLCSGSPPATQQTCSTQACPVQWVSGAWSSCSKTCGSGVQTRTVTCRQTKDGVQSPVPDSNCASAGAKPVTSQACNTQACPTYSWQYTSWSACSKVCGSGTQTRTVSCIETNTQVVQTDESRCTGTKPVSSQACNTHICPDYVWAAGSWGQCSLACGGGSQTRSVWCEDRSTTPATTVADSQCTNTKPPATQPCNTALCPNYQYWAADWGTCSLTCGGGIMTRNVYCVDVNDQPVTADKAKDESLCAGQTPLATSQSCNEQACPVYYWYVGTYGSCDALCGGGTQTRPVHCALQGTTDPVSDESLCSSAGAKPSATQPCNTEECTVYVWRPTEWTDCSQVCGGGTRTRSVACVTSAGVAADASNCDSATMPATREVCQEQECPVYWQVGAWSECSAECEGGTMSRTVDCREVGSNALVPADRCLSSKPATLASCNIFRCPSYTVGEWSACSARCGEGVQNRTVACRDYAGKRVDLTQCKGNIPSSTQPCYNLPCPHWHQDEWSHCSKVCGGGVQTRALTCRMPHDDPVWQGRKAEDESLCPSERPATSQACNVEPCPDFHWQISEWSACSLTCGGGSQSATVTCVDKATGQTAEGKCLGSSPPSSRTCNTQPCPKYEWFIVNDTWSACNAVCGTGQSFRNVICRDTTPNAVAQWEKVADSFCDTGSKPEAVRACTLESACGANGRCELGQCQCKPGYDGTYCGMAPNITGLVTDAHIYAQGVPLGEQLTVTWHSQGALPRVSIVIMRKATWAFPIYAAANVENTGRFLWTLDSDLEAGDDYYVRVWFSPAVYAESTVFSVASPCAYTNCGLRGVCDDGVCKCTNSYSGEFCTVSPCDRAQCNPQRSSCDNSLAAPASSMNGGSPNACNCTDGWSGARCFTPPGCPDTCQNGGFLWPAESGPTCGACACTNLWAGANCETCPLQCLNGGRADEDCTVCQCSVGWFGPVCNCRYLVVTVRIRMSDVSWMDNGRTARRFRSTFSSDVAAAIPGLKPENVPVVNMSVPVGNRDLSVTFRLQEDCARKNEGGDATTAAIITRPSASLDFPKRGGRFAPSSFPAWSLLVEGIDEEEEQEMTLEEMAALLAAMFADPDSAIYRGLVTSAADPGSVVITDPLAAPEDKDPEWIFYAIIAAGALVVVLLVTGTVYCLRKRGVCCAASASASTKGSTSDIEFSSPVGGTGQVDGQAYTVVPASQASVYPVASTTASPYAQQQQQHAAATAVARPVAYNPRPAVPRAAVPVARLPFGWTEQITEDGNKYYYNSQTGVSQWERPQ